MTIKKMFALMLAVLMLCSLASCNEKPAVSSDDHSDWVWVRDYTTYGALSDTGYYYIHGPILHYFDFTANASTVLCYNAGCLHEDEQCDAYLSNMVNRPMYFYNDRLYYFDQSEPTLYSRNAIGIGLTKIGTVGVKYLEEQKVVKIGNCAIAGGYLYYEADVFSATTDENGVNLLMVEREYVGRINLTTGKDEIIIEEIHDKQHEKLILCAARANGVLLNRWEGMENMDRDDPGFTLAKIPVTLEHWDGETGETTVLFRKTIRECSGIRMVSSGKVYYTSYSVIQSDDSSHTYSYDLNTGKDETACPHRTRWHLGGAYIQCNDMEGNVFLYDMFAGKKLPYELDSSANVYNVSDKGYVMQLTVDTEDGSSKERRFYYVTLDSLADGLQEADLQYLYTF